MIYQPGVSICIPTWRRAEHLPRRIASLIATIPDCPLELIIVMDEDDEETFRLPLPFLVTSGRVRWRRMIVPPSSYPTMKWNLAAARATKHWLMVATDDVEWGSDGNWWPGYSRLPAAGYLGLHDQLSRRCGSHTLWLARRDWLVKNAGGTLVCPLVRHIFADVIMTILAVRSKTNVVAKGLIGEHIHSFDEKRSDLALDESRKRAHAWRDDGKDHRVFEDLKQRGFPVGQAASPDWKSLWPSA